MCRRINYLSRYLIAAMGVALIVFAACDDKTPSSTDGACKDAECDDDNRCNGIEICGDDGECVAGEEALLGTACDADDDMLTFDVCVAGECVASGCGDGYIDERIDEVCDDGNVSSGDGCSGDCLGLCADPGDCDDDNPCTDDTCDENVCANEPVGAGATCDFDAIGDGMCQSGTCVAGECQSAAACNDGDPCTIDSCSASNTCSYSQITPIPYYRDCDGDGFAADTSGSTTTCTGSPPPFAPTCAVGAVATWTLTDPTDQASTDCDDEVADTNPGGTEVCDDGVDNDCDGDADDDDTSVVGQVSWYVDCDNDGYAIAADLTGTVALTCLPAGPVDPPGACAGGGWTTVAPTTPSTIDCAPNDEDINPGATEICDLGIDNDCDGDADNDDPSVVGQTTWYIDCDNDSYAASTFDAETTCLPGGPAGAPDMCGAGGWTTTLPADIATIDCDDWMTPMSPGQTTAQPLDGDWNCDGSVDVTYVRAWLPCTMPPCLYTCEPGVAPFTCVGLSHWDAVTAPACGVQGTYITCEYSLGCSWTPNNMFTQTCL